MLPGTAFVVARTAHRSNASHYYVDGRKSSFGEVTALLKGKGIDLDNNRFLILQASLHHCLWQSQRDYRQLLWPQAPGSTPAQAYIMCDPKARDGDIMTAPVLRGCAFSLHSRAAAAGTLWLQTWSADVQCC